MNRLEQLPAIANEMLGGLHAGSALKERVYVAAKEQAVRKAWWALPAVRAGGYIPAVDHQTPPDVTMENYRIFVRLLREVSFAPYGPGGSSGVPARSLG